MVVAVVVRNQLLHVPVPCEGEAHYHRMLHVLVPCGGEAPHCRDNLEAKELEE